MSLLMGALGALEGVFQPSYTTVNVANIQSTTYSFSIRKPGIAAAPFLTYSFPLSPQALRKDVTAMASVYDVAGPANQNGVTRIVDSYGSSPPVFAIEGTTGWQRHNSDLFMTTGLQSVQTLEKFFAKYAALNQGVAARGESQLYTLEFWDDFRGDYYQVEPVGEQCIRQSAAQPLLVFYSFKFVAIRAVSMPLVNKLARQMLAQGASVAMRVVQSVVAPVLSHY